MSRLVIISTHAVYTSEGNPLHGAGSALESYLKELHSDFIVLKFPLVDTHVTIASGILDGKEFSQQLPMTNSRLYLYVRPLVEIYCLFMIMSKQRHRKKIFIGINPLNAMYGLMLRGIFGISNIFYYTADYAHVRFDNAVVNKLYHSIDRTVCHFVDAVWSVSTRIRDLRKKQGVSDGKNFLVPNSPKYIEQTKEDQEQCNKYELMIVSSSPTSTDIPTVLEALAMLKDVYPELSLSIIGMKNWSETFSTQIDALAIRDRVHFYGSMSHQDLYKRLKNAGVGVALYTNQSSWTYFSDSMKVRDYLACGLPVLMTDVMATAQDVGEYKAGEILAIDKQDIAHSIKKILADDATYATYKKNALKLAKDCDIYAILDQRLKPFIYI